MDDKRIINLASVGTDFHRCVLTIGNFDGVHLGHQRILKLSRTLASASSKVIALTFEPPPDLVLRPADLPRRIDTPRRKAQRLLENGADIVVFADSTRKLLSMPSDDFVSDIIFKHFRPAHMVEGLDFRFGLGRNGNIETLRVDGKKLGFETHVVEPVQANLPDDKTTTISSSLIRDLIEAGDITEANRCLSRKFTLFSEVVAGMGVGNKLGWPTCNLGQSGQVKPRDGVYAGSAEIEGVSYPAAISVGKRATVKPGQSVVEAHLIGASGDYYGKEIALQFHTLLRDQIIFADVDALTRQIAKDISDVQKLNQ